MSLLLESLKWWICPVFFNGGCPFTLLGNILKIEILGNAGRIRIRGKIWNVMKIERNNRILWKYGIKEIGDRQKIGNNGEIMEN